VVIARPWWRVLVGGKIGGALRIVRECRFLGFVRNACRFGTDAVAPVDVAVLPEGRRVYLFSTSRCVPRETLGPSGQQQRRRRFPSWRFYLVRGASEDVVVASYLCFRRATNVDFGFSFFFLFRLGVMRCLP
jgi:hypothetical protein